MPIAESPLNPKDLGGAGGELLSDFDRRRYLVQKIQDTPRPWTARFRAMIAIAIPENVTLSYEVAKSLQLTEGACEGEIIPEDRLECRREPVGVHVPQHVGEVVQFGRLDVPAKSRPGDIQHLRPQLGQLVRWNNVWDNLRAELVERSLSRENVPREF